MRTWLAACLALAATFGAANEAAGQVVMFPLDPRGVDDPVAAAATEAVLGALARIENLRVIDPATVERQLKVDLTEQARACEYDVFCLVEVGEILETTTVLLGHVYRRTDDVPDPLELKLVVLDVDRAAIAEVLIWRLADPSTLVAAAAAAGRRLFGRQDAQVTLRIEPPDAKVSLYGDPQSLPRSGPWSTWSGQYRLRVAADGYLPVDRTWRVPPGSSELRVTLDPDPLYVRSPARTAPVEPFARPSRRLGSGASAKTVGAVVVEPRSGPSKYARPGPWVTIALGLAAVTAGSVLMATAQADYNEVANEVRFSPVLTMRSDLARPARDDANFQHQVGTGVLAGGAALTVGGLLWLVLGGDDTPEPGGASP